MTEEYWKIREQIHRKSHDYFVFELGRWAREKRNMFYGATDALSDAGQAAASYEKAISSNADSKLLACYGFLQALYVQQDAVISLSRAVDLSWHPNDNGRLKEIRDARNRLTGHPALAGEHEKPKRLSSAIISYDSITERGFCGHVYYEDGSENIEVDVPKFREDNERYLAQQMKLVEKAMDEQENMFRRDQAARPLSSRFENNFEYLLQRLHCDLNNEARVGQALAHASMIRDQMGKLEKELTDRGFNPEKKLLPIIFTGLELLEKIMERNSRTPAQDEFDLIYDGLEKNINVLRTSLSAIDAKLRMPIPNTE